MAQFCNCNFANDDFCSTLVRDNILQKQKQNSVVLFSPVPLMTPHRLSNTFFPNMISSKAFISYATLSPCPCTSPMSKAIKININCTNNLHWMPRSISLRTNMPARSTDNALTTPDYFPHGSLAPGWPYSMVQLQSPSTYWLTFGLPFTRQQWRRISLIDPLLAPDERLCGMKTFSILLLGNSFTRCLKRKHVASGSRYQN